MGHSGGIWFSFGGVFFTVFWECAIPYKQLSMETENVRARRLWNCYGLTISEWDLVDAFQRSVCAICHRPNKNGWRLATDHRHKDGFFRGLLCSQCNRVLGKIEDPRWQWTTKEIKRLLEYLLHPTSVQALGREVYGYPGITGTKRHKKWLKMRDTLRTPISTTTSKTQ